MTGGALKHAASSRVALGVVFGLVVGETAGITIASWLALRFRVAELSEGLTLRAIAAVAALGGVGFTVSLFVAASRSRIRRRKPTQRSASSLQRLQLASSAQS